MTAPATTDFAAARDTTTGTAGAVRWRQFVVLAKPRIATMTVVSVLAGFVLGGGAVLSTATVGLAAGIWLVAASCGALNQWAERDTDARMKRTAGRPLPSRRLTAAEAALFGLATGIAGVAAVWFAGGPLAAGLAAATLVVYVAGYTPLKRRSIWCTAVGAVPGAMPPVIGWVGATGRLDVVAALLFAVFFFWQFPHFLAIAAMYRDQYDAAGLKMSPDQADRWGATGVVAVATAFLLIASAAALTGFAGLGPVYAAVMTAAGLWYLAASVRFARDRNGTNARYLLRVSLLYVPLWVLVTAGDHWI